MQRQSFDSRITPNPAKYIKPGLVRFIIISFCYAFATVEQATENTIGYVKTQIP